MADDSKATDVSARYALALFDLAKDSDQIVVVEADLKALKAMAAESAELILTAINGARMCGRSIGASVGSPPKPMGEHGAGGGGGYGGGGGGYGGPRREGGGGGGGYGGARREGGGYGGGAGPRYGKPGGGGGGYRGNRD